VAAAKGTQLRIVDRFVFTNEAPFPSQRILVLRRQIINGREIKRAELYGLDKFFPQIMLLAKVC